MDNAARNPPKGTIVNLVTDESFKFPFNPTVLEESIEASYARAAVIGLSHQRLSYVGTGNWTYPIELYLSQMAIDLRRGEAGHAPYVATTIKNFLASLMFPVGSEDHNYVGTPRILFIWPRTVSIVGRIVGKMSFMHRAFSSRSGAPLIMVAKFSIEEDRDTMILMDEVREYGAQHYLGGNTSPRDEVVEGSD